MYARFQLDRGYATVENYSLLSRLMIGCRRRMKRRRLGDWEISSRSGWVALGFFVNTRYMYIVRSYIGSDSAAAQDNKRPHYSFYILQLLKLRTIH